ncbi:MAG: phosphoenolpyruvate carboxykinase (GTP) [Thermoplasmata archaeon]
MSENPYIPIEKLPQKERDKLLKIKNRKVMDFVKYYYDLLTPSSIFVVTDTREDYEYIRRKAIELGEESELKKERNTYHFDNYYDQARDKENTRMLTSEGEKIPFINSMRREDGIKEVETLMKGAMKGRTMIIGFFSLGAPDSPISLKAVQITDSFYVMHSEMILYRTAYQYFVDHEEIDFLRFVHSQGEVDERKTSKNLKNRRVFFDLESSMSLSVNTQYAGNTVGPKKLAFRLTINKAVKEGWLSEHMFIMGVNGPNGRVTYLTGAFPSGCGKTSTCTVQGERIVGDDLALIRERDGQAYAISPEIGIFGIIEGINKEDDKAIWNVLHGDDEVIYSNVLVHDGKPYWNGMGEEIPSEGINHSGVWYRGKKDAEGNEIPPSHKNARFTVGLSSFPGLDREALNSRSGVPVGGMIFGGRDSDTWPPVCESLSWDHGVVNKGASIESESTAATLGKVGVRTFNAMSIMEFMSVDLGKYLRNYLDFGKKLSKRPLIFGVNYFLKEDGKYLNEKVDKAVWLKWMERRVHGELGAIRTPIGYLPKYEDLKSLFKSVLGREYTREDYEKQFSIRAAKLIEKNKRIRDIYASITTTPPEVFKELDDETARLKEAREKYGDMISPFKFS